MTNSKGTLIVILGPTGSGKTDLSIAVAERFQAPILSTDSRQFFCGMPIGTAQPDENQLARVKHYFIGSHSVMDEITSGRYEKEALNLLETLFGEHPFVVAVGGSGLYIDALCYGMDNLPDADPAIRAELAERLQKDGLGSLCEELKERDPEFYGKVDKNNPRRVMRALEVCISTGCPYSAQRSGSKAERNFRIIKIGTQIPREILYDRINRRVDLMMEAGLEHEARALYPQRHLNSLQTVGYREMFDYFDRKTSKEKAVELIKQNTRRYAKRQITWFGRDDSTAWFDPSDTEKVIKYIEGSLE